jgi:energy-coupling factor transporter ATP-binding protein EcfA2
MDPKARGELSASLTALAELLARRQASAPGPNRQARAERVYRHVAEYLLPRTRSIEAPLTVVLLGSTGSGKSSLFNALAGRRASPAGVLRPTTRRPVMLTHPDDAGLVRRAELLPGLVARDSVDLIVAADARRGLLVIDAPDFDSVELSNRAMAIELLEAADLAIFVTSAARYADQVPWAVLGRARQRGVPMLTVLNRLPADHAEVDAVVADYRRLLEHGGLAEAGAFGDLEIVAVREGAIDPKRDALDSSAVEPIRRALDRLVADDEARRSVARRSLAGALAGLPAAIEEIASEVTDERTAVEMLLDAAGRSYAERRRALGSDLRRGTFLRSEVLRQWLEFVDAGRVARILAEGIGRLAATLRGVLRPGPAPPATEVREAAFADLVALVVAHGDAAAQRTAVAWNEDRYGAEAIGAQPRLWRASPELSERLTAELEAWAGRIGEVIARLGPQRRGWARAASLGTNALGTTVVLAVFMQTGGLTGAEVGITAATAAVNHKLLEAIFGEANVRAFVSRAREELDEILDRAFAGEEMRFTAALGPLAREADLADRLRSAANALAAEAPAYA